MCNAVRGLVRKFLDERELSGAVWPSFVYININILEHSRKNLAGLYKGVREWEVKI